MIALLLFAAAHIYSPNFGAFVKTGPGVTLDNSVSSVNTPGSCDFVPAAHPYLKRTEATAFYAIFDNYYAHQLTYKEGGINWCTYYPGRYGYPGYYICSTNHTYLTVTTNALFNYSKLMSIADNLLGYYASSGGPFRPSSDGATSSSAFETVGLASWSTHDFLPTSSLDAWGTLAVLNDLNEYNSIFHYNGYWYGSDAYHFRDMANYCTFHEYMEYGQTEPDLIRSFNTTRSHTSLRMEDLANAVWPGNDIRAITNRTRSISWKPIIAISQTLALMDSYICAPFKNCNFYSSKHHDFSQEATDDDCGTLRVVVTGESGEMKSCSMHPHTEVGDAKHAVEDVDGTTFYTIRASGVSHAATVVAYTNIQSKSQITIPASEIFYGLGITPTNGHYVIGMKLGSGNLYGSNFNAYFDFTDFNSIEASSAFFGSCDISDVFGEHNVSISGTVKAGYFIYETDLNAIQLDSTGIDRDVSIVDGVNEYWLMSYACSTNAPFNTDWEGNFKWPNDDIDFGYYPPSSKPYPRDDSMRWGYRRQKLAVSSPTVDSYKNASLSFHARESLLLKNKVMDEIYGLVGDIWDYEAQLHLSPGTANALLRETPITEAHIKLNTEEILWTVVEFDVSTAGVGTSYYPEEVYYHPSVSVSGSRTEHEPIVPSVGGDTRRSGKVKCKMKYPSLRTY